MSVLEPEEEIERWIKETEDYIRDARELAKKSTVTPSLAPNWLKRKNWE